MVVKGVARFVNETQLSRSEWMSFASTMAASVVAKMLNDPVVFQEWPHCNQGKLHHNNSNPCEIKRLGYPALKKVVSIFRHRCQSQKKCI